jgi:Ni/Co efflux regulator RcnB
MKKGLLALLCLSLLVATPACRDKKDKMNGDKKEKTMKNKKGDKKDKKAKKDKADKKSKKAKKDKAA